MSTLTAKPPRLIGVKEVASRYGIGSRTVWRWLKMGLIPRPVDTGAGGVTRWRESDIDDSIEKMAHR